MSRNISHSASTLASLVALVLVLSSSASAFAGDPEPIRKGSAWNPAQSDQWVATDALGRALPTFAEVGPTRPDKFVACFYFLWNGRHGDAGPYDINKILAEHPEARDDPNAEVWGALGAPHHWGESIFGYYVCEDESVLRKHAQMLGDAGVDVICFDVTNQLTYPESYQALFKVFSEMQKEGNKVPKVAFLCPFWAPNKVVRELWRDVYSKDYYSDVWFYWKGKPLILADPDLLGVRNSLPLPDCQAASVENGQKLTQKFAVDKSFNKITLSSPTWKETNSIANVALLDESGKVVARSEGIKVEDNAPYWISFDEPLPAGTYVVELTKGDGGRLGWWSREFDGDNYEEAAAKAYPIEGVKWLGATRDGKPENVVRLLSFSYYDKELDDILDFFTFRPSQPDYFRGPSKPNQWSWLEAFPQHEYYNDKGELEEMGVGVAQNAVDGKLGPMSNPRAYGRNYHDGAEPDPKDCDYTGRNFQEQWERALKVDPEILFVTGWNEWIAGRFDINAPFYGSTPVTFVDQFNEEFSRDCEPMKGGHGDAYYYQLISNIRRFKGVSRPAVCRPQLIMVNGNFDDWGNVEPKYFDTIADQTRRDSRGWGKDSHYVNDTGRNDFVEARVSYDKDNLCFFARMKNGVKADPTAQNWLTLYLDVDDDPTTGPNGAEYVVMPLKGARSLALYKTTTEGAVEGETTGGIDASVPALEVAYRVSGERLELSIPRAAVGLDGKAPVLRFKWTDGIAPFAEWPAFTTDGDAAPNDRYFYRYAPTKE